MEYDIQEPLARLHVKSDLIHIVRLSFTIELLDDLIHVTFHFTPIVGHKTSVWYESTKHGTALSPFEGFTSTDPENLAFALLASIGAQQEHKVINIERDYAELKVPAFVQNGPVSPYAPGMDISSKRVEGTVLVADLRGFSSWESSSSPEAVQALFETISERIVQMQIDNYFDYWKLMGDGIMLVWESKENVDTALLSVSAAFDLRKHYWYVKKELPEAVPNGFGIAIAAGHLTRYRSRTFFESVVIQDYLGPSITWAARIQSLAKPGEVLVNRKVAMTLKNEWYWTTNETKRLGDVSKLKGIPEHSRELFRAHHKYFDDEWTQFIRHSSEIA